MGSQIELAMTLLGAKHVTQISVHFNKRVGESRMNFLYLKLRAWLRLLIAQKGRREAVYVLGHVQMFRALEEPVQRFVPFVRLGFGQQVHELVVPFPARGWVFLKELQSEHFLRASSYSLLLFALFFFLVFIFLSDHIQLLLVFETVPEAVSSAKCGNSRGG